MKIILHIGYPKCASTSLQAALQKCGAIKFSRFGQHQHEHLAVPLKLKGLDSWTAQWFSQDWVDSEFDALVNDVKDSRQTVVISSERLADITPAQLDFLRSFFPSDLELEILMLTRPKDEFVKSMWKHAVYRHDLSESFECFCKSFDGFDMAGVAKNLASYVQVTVLDISNEGWQECLSNILGVDIALAQENVGVGFLCCDFLQRIHIAVGSSRFKSFFTEERKREFAKLFEDSGPAALEEFIVPIMSNSKS